MYFVTGPDGSETGPVDLETLRQWAAAGKLPPHAPVRQVGRDAQPASRVAELAQFYPGARSPEGPLGSLIPTGNPAALWGYYLGFAGLFPILGAFAVPFGIWQSIGGVKAYRQAPEIRGYTHAIVGLVLGGIGILIQVFFIVTIIAMVTAGRR